MYLSSNLLQYAWMVPTGLSSSIVKLICFRRGLSWERSGRVGSSSEDCVFWWLFLPCPSWGSNASASGLVRNPNTWKIKVNFMINDQSIFKTDTLGSYWQQLSEILSIQTWRSSGATHPHVRVGSCPLLNFFLKFNIYNFYEPVPS